MKISAAYIVVFLTLLVAVGAQGRDLPVADDPLAAIEQDYRDGTITLDQRVLLQITAIKHPEELPRRYQQSALSTQAIDHDHGQCASMVLRQILIDDWSQLDPQTQRSVTEALARPGGTYTFDSPGGYFKLHYDVAGFNAVPSADADLNGVPDFIEKIAAYCDTSLDVHRQTGYRDPPLDDTLGGDSLYDIYFENSSIYGYTVPDGPGPEIWNDYRSYIVLNNDFEGFPSNTDPEGSVAGAAKATVAHEFHHAVQFGYDVGEYGWFMELDATCMEDIVFDLVNDNYNYLPTYMNSPGTSLMATGKHQYASFIWGLYLAEKFDTSIMVAAWEGARYQTVWDALGDTLDGWYGWTTDSAFADFAAWLYYAGSRDDGQHFSEGAYYPDLYISRYAGNYPVYPSTSAAVGGYATCLIQFLPPADDGELTINFDGSDAVGWAARAILAGSAGDSVVTMNLLPGTWVGQLVIPHFSSYTSVTLIGINTQEFSGTAAFEYSASVRKPFAVSSKVLVDSLDLYSGAPRDVSYRVYNTSEFNDVYDVMLWDTEGWAVADTVDRFIAAGDSITVTFAVYPPEGTSLSSQSVVTFRAESHSDPLVWDEQLIGAMTVLQRGDVNFSGEIDVSDLTALVNFLFVTGVPPEPIEESGNVNCVGTVDISDLTYLVNFLFLYGPDVPCNPF